MILYFVIFLILIKLIVVRGEGGGREGSFSILGSQGREQSRERVFFVGALLPPRAQKR